MAPLLSSYEPAQEIVPCDVHRDRSHFGEPWPSQLTIARRETIWLRGEQFWEAWCEGTYPADAFHDQAFARAQEFGELYVYRVGGGPSGNELGWQGRCGRCGTGTESHDAFLVMDLYLQHDCLPGPPKTP